MRFNTGPPEDHSRVLIGHVDGDDYVCLTPDNDMWVETIVADGADVLLVALRPADLTLPFIFPADGTYLHDFVNRPQPAQQDGLLFLGQTAGNAERIGRGLVAAVAAMPGGIPPVVGPVLPIAGGPPAAPGVLVAAAGPGGAPPVGAGVAGGPPAAAVAGGGAAAGAVGPGAAVLGGGPPAGGAAGGLGGLAGLAGALAGVAAPGAAPAGGVAPVGAPGGWVAPLAPPADLRVMNVKYDHAGKRFRECRDALSIMQLEEAWDDWPIKGPRTVRWCLEHMITHAGTPKGWHQKWMSEMRLSTTDTGVDIHETACHTLELMLCYDQYHIGNSAAAEKLARDLQMQEERYADKINGQREGSEEAAIFGGVGTRGNLCICPELKAHVAEELKAITSVAKERRKAREERALVKPKKNGAGGNS